MSAEPTATQKRIMGCTSALFIALLLVPGLDRRFGWSSVPAILAVLGDAFVALGFYAIHRVFKANSFAAATVQVAKDQRVISAGPYALVRHPMYSSAFLYLFGMGLALASWWASIAALAFVPLIIWRLLDEERLLADELPGYTDYCAKVRWRLVPGLY